MACLALALVPAGAHLAELPHKVRLPARATTPTGYLLGGASSDRLMELRRSSDPIHILRCAHFA
jgi:hypothetical protein